MRILALLLSLILPLSGGAMGFTAFVESSEFFSVAALDGMNSLLAESGLILLSEGYDLTLGRELLLWARDGVMASGSAAAMLESIAMEGSALDMAATLGEALAEFEAERQDAVDLQEAGTARKYLRYVVDDEAWMENREQLATLLRLPALARSEIAGKATFRRYFDREGQEFGAYFYTEKLLLDGVTREVRLEYGFQPQKGLYLAFRCPDSKGKTNTRISAHAKWNGEGWTVSGEVRAADGTYTAQGKTNSSLTLNASRKEGGVTRTHSLTLWPGDSAADFEYVNDKTLILTGTVYYAPAELAEREMPATIGAIEDVSAALTKPLLRVLRQAAPDSWQQILHGLSSSVWIDAQKEEENP
ncbi:MAG: hypothetical protein IJ157_08265 [Clostridia bacterium]|nr:hypothetical protein [Clostridia bacterium]